MSETLTIEVTQEDIEKGRRFSPDSCPIARAATRELSKAPGKILVTEMRVYVQDEGIYYATSRRAEAFVKRFDDRGREAVTPARFRFRRMGV